MTTDLNALLDLENKKKNVINILNNNKIINEKNVSSEKFNEYIKEKKIFKLFESNNIIFFQININNEKDNNTNIIIEDDIYKYSKKKKKIDKILIYNPEKKNFKIKKNNKEVDISKLDDFFIKNIKEDTNLFTPILIIFSVIFIIIILYYFIIIKKIKN